ncbi:RNA polymerase-associated protein rtf1 [Marasmius crinis-equi]|uniref:RNA polymerase-associated protein rtf1 n=1 Tax=Marasmius crinis-equi TaxID=585013 RepID=A0ABR3G1G4_9AGAR
MSDFDDELLELVEAGSEKEKKRKRSKSKPSSSKRRKASVSDDDGPESEEEEEDPYPLEGKYVDEADMNRLMQMPEVEREEILSQRAEERQRIQDKRALQQMVKDQRADGDSVAKAAKRQHTVRGATKEKTKKLDELKAKRKAKDEKSKNRGSSPKRDRSSSPMDMDMETSDEEEEEGMISKAEQEEDTYGRKNSEPDTPVTLAELQACRLDRIKLAKHCMSSWFGKYVEGAWVRYLIGNTPEGPVYRICQIDRLCEEATKPYKIDNIMFDRNVELVHGKSRKSFPLDKVSNTPFSAKEFDRLIQTLQSDKLPIPPKSAVTAKVAQMEQLASQPMTDSDITAMLLKKNQLNARSSGAHTTFERARLIQERTLAQRRQDYKEVDEIDAKLADFDAQHGTGSNGASREGTPGLKSHKDDKSDVLAMLSEKNRKANAEAVRRAELMEAEKRRRERKLAMSGSGTVTPSDPSARLRTVPRTFNAATPSSRPSTPSNTASAASKTDAPSIKDSPSQPNGKLKTFEASVIESVEIDLGDF